MMNGSMPYTPEIKLPMVDVRDCANAHLKAVEVDEAAGKRFVLCSESLYF